MKKTFFLTAVLLIAGLIALLMTGCGNANAEKILCMNDYLVVEQIGNNGYGSVHMYIDYDKIKEVYSDKIENLNVWMFDNLEYPEASNHSSCECYMCAETGTCSGCSQCNYGETCGCVISYSYAYKAYDAARDYDGAAETLYVNYGYTLQEATDLMLGELLPQPLWVLDYFVPLGPDGELDLRLKNGDELNFEWDASESNIAALTNILGIDEIRYENISLKIDSLCEIQDVDPFEKTVLYIYGKNGEAYTTNVAWAYIDVKDDEEVGIRLNAVLPENNGSLSNGDKIHVRVSDASIDEETLAREYGVRFARTEADIEVHGLNAYGQPGASNGEHAVANLNDYVNISPLKAGIQVQIDYNKLLRDYQRCLSENVPEEDLQGGTTSREAAQSIFDYMTPIFVVKAGHLRENGEGNTFTDIVSYDYKYVNGDVVNLSWQVNEEYLAMLQKVMNIEFTYSDFSYTFEDLKE